MEKQAPDTAAYERQQYPHMCRFAALGINRISNYLTSKGCRMMGWNEITGDNIRNEAHVEAVQSEKLASGTNVHFGDGEVTLINQAVEKGYKVVNSNRFFTYMDYDYNTTPLEKSYSFDPIPEELPQKDKSKILELRCLIWGENASTAEQ